MRNLLPNLPLPSKARDAYGLFDLVMTGGQLMDCRSMTTDQILDKLLLQIGKSRKRMQKLVKNDPMLMQQVMNAKPSDFREIIKRMLNNEQDTIATSLHQLAEEDPRAFQSAALGWAKFAHGTEQKAKLDVNVQAKHSLYSSIAEEYKYSEAIDAEIIEPKQLVQEASTKEEDYGVSEEELKEQTKLYYKK